MNVHQQQVIIQGEIDSWIPYRRGLRLEDRPAYDKLMEAGKTLLNDEFLSTRVIASEGLFMAGILARERQIQHLQQQVEMMQRQIEKLEIANMQNKN